MLSDNHRDLQDKKFTTYGWIVCAWILVTPFQYGYHISVLNQLQAVLTCKKFLPPFLSEYHGLPTCIPMSDLTFSVVTAIFTVGGLMGSLVANIVMDRWGRKGATRISALSTAVGAALMGIGSSPGMLGFGRFLVGFGAGIGLCISPIFLSEIAPSRISGSVGVLTQLGIVLGIMITQTLGLRFATPTQWRIVLFFSCVLSIAQLLGSTVIVESPAWLSRRGLWEEKKLVSHSLWGLPLSRNHGTSSVEDPLLDELEARREDAYSATITVPQLLTAPELRKPLIIVCFAMLSQQLSGINAVLYYSNDILSIALPKFAPYVSLGITVVNVLMTFPPILLIERMGRRQLLTVSTLGALASLVTVGFGLNSGFVTLTSIAILTFVMSFAVGLGPIPFVIIPEVSPSHAVSALSSVALSLNWTTNFVVGLIFLPLRNFLRDGDANKQGRVFYVFAAALFSSTLVLSRVFRG